MFVSSSESGFAEAPCPLARRVKSGRTLVSAALGWFLLAAPSPTLASSAAPASSASARKLGYNREIRPILSENCFACHGPDKNQRKGKLRLDLREAAVEKKAIVAGKPEESELVKRIYTTNADDVMPPPESHKTVTPRQKELLSRWIAEG